MQKENTIIETNFSFSGISKFVRGKVRDIYVVEDRILVLVTTDRVSAFDHIMDKGIPQKGAILNTLAKEALLATKDIVPNWFITSPHPMVSIGIKCEPIPVEFVVRGYLSGHAWREYKSGKRMLCGNKLPEGLKENDKLPEPILTPSTKNDEKDVDTSKTEILKKKILSPSMFDELHKTALLLFKRGTELARNKGLILVDTKYEFGIYDGNPLLIDEVHTPDSSRYFYANKYEKKQQEGKKQTQLSKEFLREWLLENGFSGQPNTSPPSLTTKIVAMTQKRYETVFDFFFGKSPNFDSSVFSHEKIEESIKSALNSSLLR